MLTASFISVVNIVLVFHNSNCQKALFSSAKLPKINARLIILYNFIFIIFLY